MYFLRVVRAGLLACARTCRNGGDFALGPEKHPLKSIGSSGTLTTRMWPVPSCSTVHPAVRGFPITLYTGVSIDWGPYCNKSIGFPPDRVLLPRLFPVRRLLADGHVDFLISLVRVSVDSQ